MLPLVAFICSIVTVYSQCNDYYGLTTGQSCGFNAPSSCTVPSPATPYHCDESSLQQGDCVDYTDVCATCAQMCTYSALAAIQGGIASPDEVYLQLSCNTNICTLSPTESPLAPDSPTRAPTIRPTSECERFTCDPTVAPSTNCGGQPAEPYSCEGFLDQSCTSEDTKCGACCRADVIKITQGQSIQESFETQCEANGECPTTSPTKAPILPGTPTQAPIPAPTTACGNYNCDPTLAPNTHCSGQSIDRYACTPLTQGCSNETTMCSACCWADKNKITGVPQFDQTQQEAFDQNCAQGMCPTVNPTQNPSSTPSKNPSSTPSKNPTQVPLEPSVSPTKNPSQTPTQKPSKNPLAAGDTHHPTTTPSSDPTNAPSKDPSEVPSESPVVPEPSTSPVEAEPTISPVDICVANDVSKCHGKSTNCHRDSGNPNSQYSQIDVADRDDWCGFCLCAIAGDNINNIEECAYYKIDTFTKAVMESTFVTTELQQLFLGYCFSGVDNCGFDDVMVNDVITGCDCGQFTCNGESGNADGVKMVSSIISMVFMIIAFVVIY